MAKFRNYSEKPSRAHSRLDMEMACRAGYAVKLCCLPKISHTAQDVYIWWRLRGGHLSPSLYLVWWPERLLPLSLGIGPMFEIARFAGTTGRRIVVQTHRGTELENYVAPDVTTQSANLYVARRKQHPGWVQRKPATGVYNCAGMVWASRRTTLPEPSDWRTVLQDDNYRPLQGGELPRVGDVVLYIRKGTAPEVLHVAVVLAANSSSLSMIPIAASRFASSANGTTSRARTATPWKISY